MNKRYLGAVILSPLIILLFLGGFPLKILITILSLMGMHEFYSIMKNKNIKPISILGYVLSIVYYLIVMYTKTVDFQKVFLLAIAFTFIMLVVPIFNEKYNFVDIAVTLLGFLYVSIFFSFIILTSDKLYGRYLVWIIFISAWLCDTTAYYAGRLFGKHKLCPRVSPKKTIEGSIGGLLGSTIACGIYGIFVISKGVNIPIFNFLLMGLFNGVFSQLGDLTASYIKRYIGVKDYSNLIPGHGGILDRFDSILFTSVVVYYYVTIIMGM